jgi:hypothetical protein
VRIVVLEKLNTKLAEKSAATLKMETAGFTEQLFPVHQATLYVVIFMLRALRN